MRFGFKDGQACDLFRGSGVSLRLMTGMMDQSAAAVFARAYELVNKNADGISVTGEL